jgi:hypothetical protein
MSKFLGKEMLLSKASLKIEKVELSNGHVFIREMTGKEKDVWELSMVKKIRTGDKKNPIQYETTLENFRAKLAVVTLCNKEGDLIFGANDIEALNSAIKASDLEKIVEKAQELNAISEQDKEEILKNSDVGQEDNSSSGSVNN